MEDSVKDLAGYRMEKAEKMLIASEENLKIKEYNTSLNRSYYAIFHAMRAVNSLDRFDSSKHSGVIAHFNQTVLKEEKLDRSLYRIIKDASSSRENSDYDDFFVATKTDAETQLENARNFVRTVDEYLKEELKKI